MDEGELMNGAASEVGLSKREARNMLEPVSLAAI